MSDPTRTVSLPLFTAADRDLLQRTMAVLRAADLMADAIPALSSLQQRVGTQVFPLVRSVA